MIFLWPLKLPSVCCIPSALGMSPQVGLETGAQGVPAGLAQVCPPSAGLQLPGLAQWAQQNQCPVLLSPCSQGSPLWVIWNFLERRKPLVSMYFKAFLGVTDGARHNLVKQRKGPWFPVSRRDGGGRVDPWRGQGWGHRDTWSQETGVGPSHCCLPWAGSSAHLSSSCISRPHPLLLLLVQVSHSPEGSSHNREGGSLMFV